MTSSPSLAKSADKMDGAMICSIVLTFVKFYYSVIARSNSSISVTSLTFLTSPWKTSPVIWFSLTKGLSTSFHSSLFEALPKGITPGSIREIPEYVNSLSFVSELIFESDKLKSPIFLSFF